MSPRFHTVLFDLDGTLIDSRKDLATAVNSALAALGRPPMTLEAVTPHIGNGLRRLLHDTTGETDGPRLDMAVEAFRDYYGKHLLVETTLYDGVETFLKTLDKRIACAVVSNKPENFSRTIVDALGLAPYMKIVVGGDSTPKPKPDPGPFKKALAATGGTAQNTIIVGDGIQDIQGGMAMGMKTCLAAYGYGATAAAKELKSDFVIHSFRELKEILI